MYALEYLAVAQHPTNQMPPEEVLTFADPWVQTMCLELWENRQVIFAAEIARSKMCIYSQMYLHPVYVYSKVHWQFGCLRMLVIGYSYLPNNLDNFVVPSPLSVFVSAVSNFSYDGSFVFLSHQSRASPRQRCGPFGCPM